MKHLAFITLATLSLADLVAPAAFIGSAPLAAQEPTPLGFATDPHYHQGQLVFAFRGDIWRVDADGDNPTQLTRHSADDSSPRYSPDGRWLAFTSDRMGNDDVWVMPASGGEPRQLTFHTGGDDVVTWTPDSRRVVFSSSRGWLMWESQLHSVSVDGDLPVALPLGASVAGTFAPDGGQIAFNRRRYPDPKRNYRGSAAADVWVASADGGDFRQLTNATLEDYRQHAHDAEPMFGADGRVYFSSERDGVFNIWRVQPDGGAPEQVTRHTSGGVRFPSISPDGRVMAYSNEFDLWTLDIADGQPRRVSADLGWVVPGNLVEFITTEEADDFAPSPTGDFVAVDFRGELFIVPAEDGVGERTRVTRSAWRQRGGLYSPDGRFLAYISDETQDEEVWVYDVAAGTSRKLTTQPSKKSLDLWSPDGSRVFFTADTTLYSVAVDGGRTTRVAANQAGGYSVTGISPDGKWLVVDRSNPYQNVEVYLYEIATGREHNVTDHAARDAGGMLAPDGSRIFFVSNRDGGTNQLFSVVLERPTEDPDDPRVRERLRRAAADEGGARGRTGAGTARDSNAGDDAETTSQFTLDFDLEDIGRRAIQLTDGDDAVSSPFLSRDGATIYFISGTGSERGLFAIDADGENRRRIAAGAFQDLTVTADGRTVFYRDDDELFRLPLTGSSRNAEQVEFSVSFAVDKREEWRQMFDELYRHWKYSYVEEDFLGLDWDAVRARYEPMVDRIAQTADFYQLAAEMLHEVPSSHSGISGPGGGGGPDTYSTRFTGLELEPDARGLRVAYIYRDGPADRVWLDVDVGDYVVAIDGTDVHPTENYWQLLNEPLNEYVTLTVADAPDGAARRDLRIRTVESLNTIRYEDWVARNREFVERESGGRIAYMHIRSMNQQSLERFTQELDENFYRQGMIIDVRYNGGGNIDQQLMDVLQRKPYEYTWTRTGSPLWGRRPQQIVVGPQVMMHNWRSGSNAEMVPHAFRELELGTLVGTPTNGAVVSARQHGLLDGGSVRIPGVRVVSYDPEQPNNFGYSLENYGVPPDIWVRNSPDDQLRGFDRELQAAIEEALRLLGTRRWQNVTEGNGGH